MEDLPKPVFNIFERVLIRKIYEMGGIRSENVKLTNRIDTEGLNKEEFLLAFRNDLEKEYKDAESIEITSNMTQPSSNECAKCFKPEFIAHAVVYLKEEV